MVQRGQGGLQLTNTWPLSSALLNLAGGGNVVLTTDEGKELAAAKGTVGVSSRSMVVQWLGRTQQRQVDVSIQGRPVLAAGAGKVCGKDHLVPCSGTLFYSALVGSEKREKKS
eukprot:1621146-Amphidinium_carterae.1